jgi:hypothetical protein
VGHLGEFQDALLLRAGTDHYARPQRNLGIEGEVRWVVPPLSVPEQGRRTPSSEELEAYESMRLFVELPIGSRGLISNNNVRKSWNAVATYLAIL